MKLNFSLKNELNDKVKNMEGVYKLSDEELKDFQNCLLEIYSDIYECCEKHNLKVFLQGGTLLGKERHNGFIPWDDDLDLGMLRDDYNKFRKVFKKEMGDKYLLQGPRCKDGVTARFIKVYKKNSYFESVVSIPYVPKKIFIDIFPIDYAPNSQALRKLKGVVNNGLMFIASCIEHKQLLQADNMAGKISIASRIRILIGSIFSFNSIEKWMNLIDTNIQINYESNYLTSATGRRHYLGEVVEKDVFLPLKRTEFCGYDAWTLNQPDKYLTNLYGDYMQIPDESKRESHFVKKIILDGEE